MLIPLSNAGTGMPVIIIHGSDGEIHPLQALAARLGEGRPVLGIRSQLFDSSMDPLLSIEDLARHYILDLDAFGLHRPFLLLGYSFGGLVAFEIAQQLGVLGCPPGFLGVLDTWLPVSIQKTAITFSAGKRFQTRVERLFRHARRMIAGPDRRRWFRETVISKFRVSVYLHLMRRGRDIPRWFRDLNDLNLMMAARYQPRAYTGPMVLFAATEEHRDKRLSPHLGWESINPGIRVVRLPGDHHDLVRKNAPAVADIILNCLPE
jgi:thioesterase domain-containing protein